MRTKGIMIRKEPQPNIRDCMIEKIVILPDEEYEYFLNHMLYDYKFIAENTDLMYAEHLDDDTWISHCLLVMGENSDDGMLVESEGADYARYAAYQAGAKSYVKEQLRMTADAILYGEIGKQTDDSWIIDWDDIKDQFDITVSRTNGIGEMLVEELEKRDEVEEIAVTEDGIEMSVILKQDEENSVVERDMLRTVNLIATYEEIFAIPKEQRITHYFGDYGCYFLSSSVPVEKMKAIYDKALSVIEMKDDDYQKKENSYIYRTEVIGRMRDCLLSQELQKGEKVLFVATEPYGGDDDFELRGGIVESINSQNKTCVVRGSFFTMEDVPLHYVLGKYNPDITENHYGRRKVEPLFGEDEGLAEQYLHEAEEKWKETQEKTEAEVSELKI